MNVHVHRTTCAVGFQFPEGGFDTRGIGGEVRGARDGGDGAAGSRRSVWSAAILSGGEENFRARAHRGGSDVCGGLAFSSAGGNARGLPKSMPADYAYEIAGAQGRRACVGRRGGRKSRGADLPDGRERRAAGACAGAGRRGKWIGLRAAALRNFWARKCVCGIAAAFRSGGRSAQSRGGGNRSKTGFAAAGDEWRVLCAAGAARSAGRVYLPAS